MARSSRANTNVSLFPFLAVLICTMGALIVLLVVVVKQAEAWAAAQQADDNQQQQETLRRLRMDLEDQKFLRDTLLAQRPQMVDKLADERLRLSHLEDHIRQLKQQAEQLQQSLKDLEQLELLRLQDRGKLEQQLADLQQQLEEARRQLAEAQQAAAQRRRSYAIIPYAGPNGTNRRPIYLECTAEGIIFRPEDVQLGAGDFLQPLLPGNPLDAALLAIREHWARTGLIDRHNEPYPLLIIRPGGAEAYALAREAMKSWEEEFGYELVSDDMQLVYPPADPVLQRVIRQAIEDAKRRQAILAQAQPSRFRYGAAVAPRSVADDVEVEMGGPSPGGSDGQPPADAQSPPAARTPADSQPGADAQRSVASPGDGPAGAGGPLAAQRGANWALPSKAPGAIGFTRPIRVQCFADRLVVMPPKDGTDPPEIVPLRGPTRSSIDAFVAAIWKHMQAWGIAGRNAYWKPLLNVQVMPGGESRFAELEQLLQNSGLEIRRAGP